MGSGLNSTPFEIISVAAVLGEVVFIGGVSNALYEYHSKASASGNRSLYTKDLDIAVPKRIQSRTETPSISKLLEAAGFKVNRNIEMKDGVTKFYLENNDVWAGNYHVEFLCPLTGKDQGQESQSVQADLSATPTRPGPSTCRCVSTICCGGFMEAPNEFYERFRGIGIELMGAEPDYTADIERTLIEASGYAGRAHGRILGLLAHGSLSMADL